MEIIRCMIMGKNGITGFKLGVLKAGLIRDKYRYVPDGVFLTKMLYGLFTVPTLLYPRGSFDPVLWNGAKPPTVEGKTYSEEQFSDIIEGLAFSMFEFLRDKSSTKENIMLYLLIGIAAMFVFVFFIGGISTTPGGV